MAAYESLDQRRAVIDRKSIHVHDLQAEKAEFPDGHTMAQRMGHGQVFLSLCCEAKRQSDRLRSVAAKFRPFTPRQIELAETFA